MGQNAKARKAKEAEAKKQPETKEAMEMQIETGSEEKIRENKAAKPKTDIKEIEIEPHHIQFFLQLGESITESMPQIMLQSVFIIRSYNDERIPRDDLLLISFSVLASLISIANKYVYLDEEPFDDDAKSLTPKMKFPNCVNYWYVLRVIWRVSDIMSKFAVYVLIWVVLGGAFLPIWGAIIFICWSIYRIVDEGRCESTFIVFGLISLGGIFTENDRKIILYIFKFVENGIGLGIVLIFAMVDFDCGICASSELRRFSNETNNTRILRFYIMGCSAAVIEIISFVLLRHYRIVKLD